MSIISKAYAEGAAPGAQGGGMEMIIMLAVFGLIFYFMILSSPGQACQGSPQSDELLVQG